LSDAGIVAAKWLIVKFGRLFRLFQSLRESNGIPLFRHKDVGGAGAMLEHCTPIQADDDNGSGDKQEIVPGLGIGPDGIHHLEVEQAGDQDAAAGVVEHRSEDDGHGYDAGKVRRKGPGALGRPAHQKRGDVPGSPDDAEDQAGPEWSEPALQ